MESEPRAVSWSRAHGSREFHILHRRPSGPERMAAHSECALLLDWTPRRRPQRLAGGEGASGYAGASDALGPQLSASGGGVPLGEVSVVLVELLFRVGAGAILVETALIRRSRGAYVAVNARTVGGAEAVCAEHWRFTFSRRGCAAFSRRRCATFSFSFSFPVPLPGVHGWSACTIVRVRWVRLLVPFGIGSGN